MRADKAEEALRVFKEAQYRHERQHGGDRTTAGAGNGSGGSDHGCPEHDHSGSGGGGHGKTLYTHANFHDRYQDNGWDTSDDDESVGSSGGARRGRRHRTRTPSRIPRRANRPTPSTVPRRGKPGAGLHTPDRQAAKRSASLGKCQGTPTSSRAALQQGADEAAAGVNPLPITPVKLSPSGPTSASTSLPTTPQRLTTADGLYTPTTPRHSTASWLELRGGSDGAPRKKGSRAQWLSEWLKNKSSSIPNLRIGATPPRSSVSTASKSSFASLTSCGTQNADAVLTGGTRHADAMGSVGSSASMSSITHLRADVFFNRGPVTGEGSSSYSDMSTATSKGSGATPSGAKPAVGLPDVDPASTTGSEEPLPPLADGNDADNATDTSAGTGVGTGTQAKVEVQAGRTFGAGVSAPTPTTTGTTGTTTATSGGGSVPAEPVKPNLFGRVGDTPSKPAEPSSPSGPAKGKTQPTAKAKKNKGGSVFGLFAQNLLRESEKRMGTVKDAVTGAGKGASGGGGKATDTHTGASLEQHGHGTGADSSLVDTTADVNNNNNNSGNNVVAAEVAPEPEPEPIFEDGLVVDLSRQENANVFGDAEVGLPICVCVCVQHAMDTVARWWPSLLPGGPWW